MVQLQVLNKILKEKDFSIISKNNLDSSYFSDFRQEFEFIKNHYDVYHNIPDLSTFLSKFTTFKVIEVNESTPYLLDELFKDKNTRDLAYAFNKIREQMMSGNVDDAMITFKKASDKILQNKALEPIDILKDTSRYNEYIEKTKDFNKFYIKTGLPELDKIIGGWDRNEELCTIIARSGIGKTWLMLFFAVASAKQGLRVGIYSGEMSVNKVGYRVDTLFGGIPNAQLMKGNEDIKVQYKNYIDSLGDIKGSIFVLTPKMIGDYASVSTLRAFMEKSELDILFVDQHSLLKDEKGGRNNQEKAYNISTSMKLLQDLEKKPIICVAQMNREKNEDSDLLDLTQIANADKIGQDSTLVLGLSRDKNDENIVKLQIVKIRDIGARNKVLTYHTDLNLGVWKYIPENEEVDSEENNEYEHRYDVEGDDVF